VQFGKESLELWSKTKIIADRWNRMLKLRGWLGQKEWLRYSWVKGVLRRDGLCGEATPTDTAGKKQSVWGGRRCAAVDKLLLEAVRGQDLGEFEVLINTGDSTGHLNDRRATREGGKMTKGLSPYPLLTMASRSSAHDVLIPESGQAENESSLGEPTLKWEEREATIYVLDGGAAVPSWLRTCAGVVVTDRADVSPCKMRHVVHHADNAGAPERLKAALRCGAAVFKIEKDDAYRGFHFCSRPWLVVLCPR